MKKNLCMHWDLRGEQANCCWSKINDQRAVTIEFFFQRNKVFIFEAVSYFND